ncbi:hypothetical protein D9Q98_008119 [Chlorella vulgaris]|uniref:Uncharacterized protein n=1 Tax=Chlorella vulgaris TaxID=3077 RepID=A0A9D4TG40_CHLVU|nr:hypothetical protein D9Q98_008119 [Chlorella vulgaris]
MSREELSAFLRNLQLSLDGLQREVEAACRQVPETKREALPELLAGCRRSLARFSVEQLAEFDAFVQETGLQAEQSDGDVAGSPAVAALDAGGDHGTPHGMQLRSLERRVASMGGIPALGACVLPRMTPGMRPQLNTTASPAAVEIMQRRLGGEEAMPLKKSGLGGEDVQAATPMFKLRATPAADASGGRAVTSPQGAAAHTSELAAAIQRRNQRLGSPSPVKEAAGITES